jgi:hypothetical protein
MVVIVFIIRAVTDLTSGAFHVLPEASFLLGWVPSRPDILPPLVTYSFKTSRPEPSVARSKSEGYQPGFVVCQAKSERY